MFVNACRELEYKPSIHQLQQSEMQRRYREDIPENGKGDVVGSGMDKPLLVDYSLSGWIEKYNHTHLHPVLGYKATIKFEEEYQNSLITPLVGA